MTWTTPNTVATGDIYTAAMYNTYVRDNSNHLRLNTGSGDPSDSNQVALSTGTGAGSVWSTVPDAAMTNQKINKRNISYTSMAAPAAIVGNSGFFDVTVPSADAPTPGAQYHVFQSMRNDSTINYTCQIAVNLTTPTPLTYIRMIVAGTPSPWYKIWNETNDGVGSGLDADTVDGLDPGNSSGNLPRSNGVVNTNLSADMVDGYHVGNGNNVVPISNGTLCQTLNADKVDGYEGIFLLPNVGDVKLHIGSSEATVSASGWKFMNGQQVSRTTFSALFALISTTYGVGNGSTTYNLPDWRGRTALGVDASHPLGTTGGAFTKNLTHAHGVTIYSQVNVAMGGTTDNTTTGVNLAFSGSEEAVPRHRHHVSGNTNDVSGMTAVDVTNPYGTGNWCVYTGVAT